MITTNPIRDTASTANRLGYVVLPTAEDGSKRPDVPSWAEFQKRKPTDAELKAMFPLESPRSGLGLVTGTISNGLELLEFDDAEAVVTFQQAATDAGLDHLVRRLDRGYRERTPGGGLHYLYRTPEPLGNTKLARRPCLGPPSCSKHQQEEVHVLLETRGQGGYVVIAPSNGKTHPSGGAYVLEAGSINTIPLLTTEERDDLFALARTLDEMPPPPEISTSAPRASAGSGDLPGEDFNLRATWAEVLEPAGWRHVYRRGDVDHWRRPGKREGISATTNYHGSDLLYVFSTSVGEFEPEQGYSKWRAYALLNHGADFEAAARDLGSRGYGRPAQSPARGVGTTVPTPTQITSAEPSIPWPAKLEPEAFYGLTGDIIEAIAPTTEADDAALLIQFLTFFGNAVGQCPYWTAEADRHYLNLFAVIVADSAKGRKGTSLGRIRAIFDRVLSEWTKTCITSGLSSGEGVIWNVRDPITKQEPIRENKQIVGYQDVTVDEGVADKRLLVIEGEYAQAAKVMAREGNTLSPVLRNAWDGLTLRALTKNSPAQATGAHISLIGHITRAELLRHFSDTEAGNGYGNRHLWVAARRARVLPEGGDLDAVNISALVLKLHEAIEYAATVGEMRRDDEARAMWREVYPELSEGKPGLLGAVLARAEAQVMRLACIYALLDLSAVVRPEHLKAGLAVWQYCEDSARWIFGDRLGDPTADEIIVALRRSPSGLTRTQISELFQRNRSTHEISRALAALLAGNLAYSETSTGEAGGRPVETWKARYEIDERNEITPPTERVISSTSSIS